jgi:D-serine deaminase-like pyridoxal phosphate-dependent protein
MDVTPEYLQGFIGRPAIELPTPSLILSRNIIEKNCDTVLELVQSMNLDLRAHVKTLKVSDCVF